jgi:hypothetical protein
MLRGNFAECTVMSEVGRVLRGNWKNIGWKLEEDWVEVEEYWLEVERILGVSWKL